MYKLSSGLKIAWRIAALEAIEKRSESIEVIHFVLGLLSFDKIPVQQKNDQVLDLFINEKKVFYNILTDYKINIIEARRALRSLIPQGSANYQENIIHRSEECKNILIMAGSASGQYITSLDYFAASLSISSSPVGRYMHEYGIDVESLRRSLALSAESASSFFEPEDGVSASIETISDTASGKYKYISKYGKDMISIAEKSLYSVFEGRTGEIRQLITTLGKKTKNNPIIIGEPGVGKSAIVEGLATMIYQGKVLQGKKIFQISASSLVSGTKYRGEFEERLLNIIEEAARYPEIILFFDELHQFIGAGGAEGGLDAANILKPALSRQGFTCIGATTIADYHKYIEKDSAFTRRFQKIIVNEPSGEETINILNRIKPDLEAYHNVIISDEAIRTAVDYSIRYETNKCLPDKAIDLLDESCSALSNKTITLSGFENNQVGESTLPVVDSNCIALLLSRRTGIPIAKITQIDAQKYLKLEVVLKAEIKGQDEIVEEISNFLKISKAGMGNPNKPVGVFLFIGPSGVGKTFLAKRLAASLFTSESDLVRYDMSEYMEQHSISKLIGAPPGYILSEEEGILIKNLRNKPYSVVLFDEIDKAHPRILDILLQLFDDGRITDNKGRLIDGRNAIFILTSNLISSAKKPVGFEINGETTINDQANADLKKIFRQEFLNRMNKILIFNSLTKKDVIEIVNKDIEGLCDLLKDKFNVIIEIEGDPAEYIMQRSLYKNYGARAVSREIDQSFKEPISQHIIDFQAQGKTISGCRLKVLISEDKIEFTINQ